MINIGEETRRSVVKLKQPVWRKFRKDGMPGQVWVNVWVNVYVEVNNDRVEILRNII